MQITLNNKQYTLNTRRAIELGVLKVVRAPIAAVDIGDVFKKEGHDAIVLIGAIYENGADSKCYSFVGLGRSLTPHSNYPKLLSYTEAMDRLNKEEWIRIGNINKEFKVALKKIEDAAEVS